jgi:protein involved in polysaccharide export with SLBB domain
VVPFLAGCQSPEPRFEPASPISAAATTPPRATLTNRLDPAWLRPGTNLFTLGPGDRLDIELADDDTTRTSTFVGPDGKIYFYLLPGLDVWGLTLAQAKALLEQQMTNYIREQPQLLLALHGVESKRVWLLGRLNAPGVYPMSGPMTLLEAISQAGGPARLAPPVSAGDADAGMIGVADEAADLRRSFVIRGGQFLPVDFQRLLKQGDISQNIYLQPDDFVYLPSAAARRVYVLGAVAQPRAVPFGGQLTLIKAIAAAGGTIKDAYLSHVAIVSGSLTQPQIAIVDYKDVVHGISMDVTLQPDDIVYVPLAPYRVLTRYLDIILETFVRTIAANEGAAAASRHAVPVSPNVPIGVTQ